MCNVLQYTPCEVTIHTLVLRRDLCCRVCEPLLSYVDSGTVVLFTLYWRCRHAYVCCQLNKWFACRCIIPRLLSSNFSSLSMYLLHVLVLSRMEPAIQILFTYLWRVFLFGTGALGNLSEFLIILRVGTAFVVSLENTWWLNGTTDDV